MKNELVHKFITGHNPVKHSLAFGCNLGAIVRAFDTFGHPAGKYQAGGTVAFFAIGLRQIFEELNHIRLGHALITWSDLIAF